jgi:hypothetical protein
MFDDDAFYDSGAIPGLAEFERAMSDAVSSGADAWIVTKAGEIFVGEVQEVTADVSDADLVGREVTITINDRSLLYQEISHWTVGLTGEPRDDQLDASILQALEVFGPMSAEDLVVRITRPPLPVWSTVARALARLDVLEAEGWVKRLDEGPDAQWRFARRRTSRGWERE